LVAICSSYTVGGNQLNFTTLAPPSVLPTVTTTVASSISSTGASTGGNVTADGGATVTARGVAYGTLQNPTISGPTTSNGTGTGTFTSTLSGLSPSTLYNVRAYATNSVGTAYGSQINFTTQAPPATLPTLTTTVAPPPSAEIFPPVLAPVLLMDEATVVVNVGKVAGGA